MLNENQNKPDFLDIAVEKPTTVKTRRPSVKNPVESTQESVATQEKVKEPLVKKVDQTLEYDLYKIYQENLKQQQTQVLAFWTQVLNNMFWWIKK